MLFLCIGKLPFDVGEFLAESVYESLIASKYFASAFGCLRPAPEGEITSKLRLDLLDLGGV